MRHRLLVLAALFGAFAAVLFAQGPIPQHPAFHLFADQRTCLGIPHFGNVASNAAFAVVGMIGLWFVLRPRSDALFAQSADHWCFIIFFGAVAWVSVGSAYYHAAPDNPRLFWDRLPMTVAFMALFAAFIIDRIDWVKGAPWVLPLLVGLGAASVLYWRWSESIGHGDLRFYAMVQFFPMLALPLICWLFAPARTTSAVSLFWLLAWYAAAMVCEALDHQIFTLLGGAVSGHTIKHGLAAGAPLVVVRMLVTAHRRHASPPGLVLA